MRWFWICVGLPALAACSHGESPGTEVGSQSQSVVAATKPAPSGSAERWLPPPPASVAEIAPEQPRGDDGKPMSNAALPRFDAPDPDATKGTGDTLSAARRSEKSAAKEASMKAGAALPDLRPAPEMVALHAQYAREAEARQVARGGVDDAASQVAEAEAKRTFFAGKGGAK